MANLRRSRFRSRADVGEDVNPSAYIVNLADCMLVLACGFLVMLVVNWQVDISVTTEEVDPEDMQQVDPETLPDDVASGGSNYIEAGKAYQDPNTGQIYIIKDVTSDTGESNAEAGSETPAASAGEQAKSSESTGSDSANSSSSPASSANTSHDDIIAARASGGA